MVWSFCLSQRTGRSTTERESAGIKVAHSPPPLHAPPSLGKQAVQRLLSLVFVFFSFAFVFRWPFLILFPDLVRLPHNAHSRTRTLAHSHTHTQRVAYSIFSFHQRLASCSLQLALGFSPASSPSPKPHSTAQRQTLTTMILENLVCTGSVWTSAGLGLGLVLLAYIATSTIKSWHRLRHIPGPPGAGFSKWWMLRNTLGGNMHLATKAACREYGKVHPDGGGTSESP